MTIKSKLVSVVIGVVFAFSFICWFGWAEMKSISSTLRDVMTKDLAPIVNEDIPRLNSLNKSVELILNADRDAYQALVAEINLTSSVHEDPTGLIESHADNLGQVYDRMELASANFVGDTLPLYERFQSQYASWSDLTSSVIQLVGDPESLAAARDLSSGEVYEAFDAMRTTIDEITIVLEAQINEENSKVKVSSADANERARASLDEASSAVIVFLSVGVICAGLIVAALTILSLSIARGLTKMLDRVEDIASGEGDLSKLIDINSKDELGVLSGSINQFINKVAEIIYEVQLASDEVSSIAMDVADSGQELASSMDNQRGQIIQVASAMTEMSSSVHEVANQCMLASEAATSSDGTAQEGRDAVSKTVSGIEEINRVMSSTSDAVSALNVRSEHIGEIVQVINDIADQTNLLALNAAIEAARANEHGRGFAVVAEEVRKLAERTQQATQEIGESIETIQAETSQAVIKMQEGTDRVDEGSQRGQEAGNLIGTVVSSVQEVSAMLGSIADATKEQSSVSDEVSVSIESISNIAETVSQTASQTAASAGQMSDSASKLKTLVGQFKLAETGSSV